MESASRRQFQIHECLGKGGFGVVYRATMQSPGGLHSDVAVKLLHSPTEDAVRRLRKEAKLLAALAHPSILRVHDLVRLAGHMVLVTEFVGGLDLADALRLDPPPSQRALVQVVGPVAEAIDAAWNRVPPGGVEPMRLVHRDIKPANIRIGAHGEVKLLDFGVAYAEESQQTAAGVTHGTSIIGSVPYMAPERFRREIAAPEGDIYALGCTLFEGVTGGRLHDGVTVGEMAGRSVSAAVHDSFVETCLAKLAEVDDALVDLIRRCTRHDPGARPSARELSRICEDLADSLPGARLKAWCRDLALDETMEGGPLSGRVLSEGTLALGDISRESTGESPFAPTADFGVSDGPTEATWSADGDPFGLTGDPALGAAAPTTAPVPTSSTAAEIPAQGSAPTSDQSPAERRSSGLVIGLAVAGIALAGLSAGGVWASGVLDAPVVAEAVASDTDDAVAAVSDASGGQEGPTVADVEEPTDPTGTGRADTAREPVETPRAGVTPRPAARPSGGTTTRTPAPAPAEAPAPPSGEGQGEPAPEPELEDPAEPATAAPDPGRFAVEGEVTEVVLVGSGGARFGPGPVPPGAYTIHAVFGSGELTDTRKTVRIAPGATLTVRCNLLQWNCSAVD